MIKYYIIKLSNLVIIFCICLWIMILSIPFLWQGRLAYLRGFELGDAVYPQLFWIVENLSRGQFSYWLPSQGGGTDLLGNFNSPLLNLIFLLVFPGWFAHSLIFLLITTTATITTYLLLVTSMQCNKLCSLIGGLIYSQWFLSEFNGEVYCYSSGLLLALAPGVVLWILSIDVKDNKNYLYSIIFGLVLSLGGHYTWSVFIMAGVMVVCVIFSPLKFLIWVRYFVVCNLVIFIVQLPFLISNISTIPFSGRSIQSDYYKYSASLLAKYVQFGDWPFKTYMLIFTSTTLFTAILTLKIPYKVIKWLLIFYTLPVLDVLFPQILAKGALFGYSLNSNGEAIGLFELRLSLLMTLSASLAFAMGIDFTWKGYSEISGGAAVEHKWRALILIFILLIEGPTIGEIFISTSQSLRAKVDMLTAGMNYFSSYERPELKSLAINNSDLNSFRVATIQFNGGDSRPTPTQLYVSHSPSFLGGFQTAYGFEVADTYMSNIPYRYLNFWNLALVGNSGFPRADFEEKYKEKFEDVEYAFTQKLYLYAPLELKEKNNASSYVLKNSLEFENYYNLALLSLANIKYFISTIRVESPYLDEVNVKSFKPTDMEISDSLLGKNKYLEESYLSKNKIYVYRNNEFIPRVFSPGNISILPTKEDLEKKLLSYRRSGDLAHEAMVLAKEAPKILLDLGSIEPISIKKVTIESSDQMEIDLDATSHGMIVVSNNFSPFWVAYIDKKSANVFPVYGAFIGIDIPAGSKHLSLQYTPPLARILSLLSLAYVTGNYDGQ